jgi:hypothetical protein
LLSLRFACKFDGKKKMLEKIRGGKEERRKPLKKEYTS